MAQGAAIDMLDVREPWEHKICLIAREPDDSDGGVAARANELTNGEAAGGDLSSWHAELPCYPVAARPRALENAVNLEGGIDAWAREIDPAMQRY